jgi:hypothetical protein
MTSRTTVDECRAAAANCLVRANRSTDPVRKGEYQVLAKKWMKLAEKFERQDRTAGSNVLLFKPVHTERPTAQVFRLCPPTLIR